MTPRASVVVPVRDDADRLHACLQALGRQTFTDFEILVVDNGSRDDPAAVVARHPRARLLHEARPSSYAARNTGVRAARGDVLAFTDSDCVPDPTWLERGIGRLESAPPASFVGGAVEVFAQDPDRPTAAELYELLRAFPQRQYVEQLHFSVTANLFVRRAVFDHVGPFAEALISSGDREWGERAGAVGVAGIYAPDVRVMHPSRRSLRDIRRKLNRLYTGRAQLQRLRGHPPVQLEPWRMIRPPVRSTYRQLSKVQPATLRSKALFFGAAILLHYAGSSEALRAALRQPPEVDAPRAPSAEPGGSAVPH